MSVNLLWLYVLMNIIIFYDLYATISNPFKKRKSRLIWYKLVIFVYIVSAFYTFFWFQEHDLFQLLGNVYVKFFLVLLPLFISVRIYVLINRKGASNELKQKILKRHFVQLVLYITIQLRLFYEFESQLQLIFLVLPNLSAIAIAYTRLRMEPYVWFLFSEEIKSCFGRRNHKTKMKKNPQNQGSTCDSHWFFICLRNNLKTWSIHTFWYKRYAKNQGEMTS